MLQKRKKPKMGIRQSSMIRSQGHLAFVRSFTCALWGKAGHECSGRMHAHHCREGANGGTGLKPDDSTAVPLCDLAHTEIHNTGWQTFEKKWGVDLSAIAADIWRVSSHRRKLDRSPAVQSESDAR